MVMNGFGFGGSVLGGLFGLVGGIISLAMFALSIYVLYLTIGFLRAGTRAFEAYLDREQRR